MYRCNVLIICLFIFLKGSSLFAQANSAPDDAILAKAKLLAAKYIITDGHVDLPYRLKVTNFRLEKEYLGIPYQTDKGDFDYVRAKEGGLDAPFMSIYIPSKYQWEGGAKELADSLIQMITFIIDNQPELFAHAHSPQDVRQAFKAGKIALPMGMENGAPVEDDLSLVSYFRKKGISYITLTHSKDNKICDSSYDTTRTWKGLSPYGFKLLDEMQRQGVMIDVSHISDSAFYQTIRYVKIPVIASHSSCRKFTPGFERNMSDDMIRKMKDNGGVIMVNFGSTFLDGNIDAHNDSLRTLYQQMVKDKNLNENSEEGKQFRDEFQKSNPRLFSDVEKVADHIDHIVALSGIDHVGFGSDYDGVGDSLPTGLKDVSDFPNLLAVLLRRGYSESDIEKICSGNLFRVWDQVVQAAK
jgi:membrane dipeptidase